MGDQHLLPPPADPANRVGAWALYVETQRVRGYPDGRTITHRTYGTEQAGLFGWRAAVRPEQHEVLVFPAGPDVAIGLDLQVYELARRPDGLAEWMQAGLLASVLQGPRQDLAARIGAPPAGG